MGSYYMDKFNLNLSGWTPVVLYYNIFILSNWGGENLNLEHVPHEYKFLAILPNTILVTTFFVYKIRWGGLL